MEDLLVQFVKPLIEALAGNYGKIAQAIAVVSSIMGLVRIVFKPIMVALHQIADDTKSEWDNNKLAQVEGSKGYKIFVFFLDYILSIKLPGSK